MSKDKSKGKSRKQILFKIIYSNLQKHIEKDIRILFKQKNSLKCSKNKVSIFTYAQDRKKRKAAKEKHMAKYNHNCVRLCALKIVKGIHKKKKNKNHLYRHIKKGN